MITIAKSEESNTTRKERRRTKREKGGPHVLVKKSKYHKMFEVEYPSVKDLEHLLQADSNTVSSF